MAKKHSNAPLDIEPSANPVNLDIDAPADPVAAQLADQPEVDAQRNGAAKKLESKADRFRRLANRRVPRALKTIQHVANLASRQSYEYTPEQAGKLVGAMKAAVAELERRFMGGAGVVETWQL